MVNKKTKLSYYAAFTDQQGSVLSVVDEDGQKVFEATYDTWGMQTVTTPPSAASSAPTTMCRSPATARASTATAIVSTTR